MRRASASRRRRSTLQTSNKSVPGLDFFNDFEDSDEEETPVPKQRSTRRRSTVKVSNKSLQKFDFLDDEDYDNDADTDEINPNVCIGTSGRKNNPVKESGLTMKHNEKDFPPPLRMETTPETSSVEMSIAEEEEEEEGPTVFMDETKLKLNRELYNKYLSEEKEMIEKEEEIREQVPTSVECIVGSQVSAEQLDSVEETLTDPAITNKQPNDTVDVVESEKNEIVAAAVDVAVEPVSVSDEATPSNQTEVFEEVRELERVIEEDIVATEHNESLAAEDTINEDSVEVQQSFETSIETILSETEDNAVEISIEQSPISKDIQTEVTTTKEKQRQGIPRRKSFLDVLARYEGIFHVRTYFSKTLSFAFTQFSFLQRYLKIGLNKLKCNFSAGNINDSPSSSNEKH